MLRKTWYMEKLERKSLSVTSRRCCIWAEISHGNPILVRHAILVWSNRLKFLIFIIIFMREIKKKDVYPWICESLPGHAAKPQWSWAASRWDCDPERGPSPFALGTLATTELLLFRVGRLESHRAGWPAGGVKGLTSSLGSGYRDSPLSPLITMLGV